MNPPIIDRYPERQWISLAGVLLVLATILFYDQTFQFQFTDFDDTELIGQHPQLYQQGTLLERIEQIVFLDYPRLEPLIVRDLSWLLDSELFGYDRPFGYHFGNVIYHALSLLLAFLVLRRLTNTTTALVTTMFVSVLAAHVESVAWIMGRKDILSTLFSLLSILFFLRFRDAPGNRRSALFYAVALVCALAACLSKINAVVLPGVLFLCALADSDEFRRHGFRAENVGRIVGLLALQILPFFIVCLAAFSWYQSVLEAYGQMDKADVFSPEQYVRLLAFVNPLILVEYLQIIFVPHELSAYYTEPSIHTDLSGLQLAISLAVTGLTVLTLLLLWRFDRVACLLALCFFILMLPYGNWKHFGFWYANRYVYFSSMFLLAAFCHVVMALLRSRRGPLLKFTATTIAAVFIVFNLTTRGDYVDAWRDGESLWTYEAGLPDAPINAYNNLVSTYLGKWQGAGPEDLEQFLQRDQWLDEARRINDRVFQLELSPRERLWLSVAHYHRGLIRSYSNAPPEEQLAEFLAAVEISPTYSDALWRVAWTYREMARDEGHGGARFRLARESLAWFRRYFATQGSTPASAAAEDRIMRELKAEFSGLDIE